MHVPHVAKRILLIDFSAAFDRVNYPIILYLLCTVLVQGFVLSILIPLPTNQPRHVMVKSLWSKMVNVVSGVTQVSALGTLLFLLYTSELFFILDNNPIAYADDPTLLSVVSSSGVRVTVAESMNRDVGKDGEECDLLWCN